MSNLWFNLRLFSWHIQIGDLRWCSVRLTRNVYYPENNWPDGWFSWY